jgi:hypothetical protein
VLRVVQCRHERTGGAPHEPSSVGCCHEPVERLRGCRPLSRDNARVCGVLACLVMLTVLLLGAFIVTAGPVSNSAQEEASADHQHSLLRYVTGDGGARSALPGEHGATGAAASVTPLLPHAAGPLSTLSHRPALRSKPVTLPPAPRTQGTAPPAVNVQASGAAASPNHSGRPSDAHELIADSKPHLTGSAASAPTAPVSASPVPQLTSTPLGGAHCQWGPWLADENVRRFQSSSAPLAELQQLPAREIL